MARTDVIVVGAGIFGLWTAWYCLRRGLSVTVLEREGQAAGASGGPLGALAPHAPDRWTPKKRIQFEALAALPEALAAVEAAGGGSAAYARVGRLQPLATAAARVRARHQADAAAEAWGETWSMGLLETSPDPDWLADEAAPFGLLFDDFTARLDPQATCEAIGRAIRAAGGRIETGVAVHRVAPGRVETATGPRTSLAAVVAAGAESFDLLAPHLGRVAGGGVKGQALFIAASVADVPVIAADGLFIVPHRHGVAVGSTSETLWDDPRTTDAALDALHARALAICPALRERAVVRRWAGIRPRAAGRDPMVGPVPGAPGLYACTGGYKIGFGLGHRIGSELAGMIAGEAASLPASFRVEAHLV
jgi:glycine/D-amino acid oxidase-like deaminating enzyme